MVHECIQKDVIQVKRRSSRALNVPIGMEKATMPIQIISTYAPHSGNKEEIRKKRWNDVNELLSKTSKRHLIICGADAYGQIGGKEN